PVGGHTPSHGVPGARQPHAESDPCARHHGAFPGRKDSLRNERKAMTPRLFAAALLALPMLVCAQDTDKPAAKPKPAAKAAAKDAVATVNGVGVPGARMEFMMEQQRQRGAPDNAQTRAMLFDELASKNSKDAGSKERGGDLDWNVPGAFDKQFSDAMVKLDKGKYTEAPVQTRFGYHVIQLDDVRPIRFPGLAEVKQRIQQQLAQQRVDELIRVLRAKAKVE